MADEDPILLEPGELTSFLGSLGEDGPNPIIITDEQPSSPFPGAEEITPPPIEDENPFEDATTPIGDGVCIVCGAPTFRPPGLTKAGHKKRTPKYCDLHAPNARIPTEGPQSARLESQLQRIQEELADDLRLGGTLIGFQFPVTGFYVFENADEFTVALLKLCKNNQRLLRVLHRAAQVAPIYTVAKDVAGTAYALQVDMNKADPSNAIANRLGVTRAYEAVFGTNLNDASMHDSNLTNNGMKPPPRYATVQ